MAFKLQLQPSPTALPYCFSWKIGLDNVPRPRIWWGNRDLKLSLSESKAVLFTVLSLLCKLEDDINTFSQS